MSSTIFTRKGLAGAFRTLREAMEVTSRAMVRIQFDAPWNRGGCAGR